MADARQAGRESGAAAVAPAVFLIVVIFAWGGNYTWVKLALQDGGPWTFNALRYGLAVLFLGAVLAIRSGWPALVPARGERLDMAVIGGLQIAVMTGATTLALAFIEASRTVLIAYSMPIWGMLLSLAILRERVTPATLAGLALGLAGLALLFAPWSMHWSSREAVLGSLVALFGTLGWALGSVLYRRRQWQSEFWPQVFWQLVAGATIVIPAAVVLETRATDPTASYVTIVVWNAVVPTILGFWCWARALHRISVTTASQILLLSPVFGVFLSALVLGEPVTETLMLSAALIIAGALLSYIRKPATPPIS